MSDGCNAREERPKVALGDVIVEFKRLQWREQALSAACEVHQDANRRLVGERDLLRVENKKFLADAQQCHQQNDCLVSEHLDLRREIKKLQTMERLQDGVIADLKRVNSDLAAAAIAPQSVADLMGEVTRLKVSVNRMVNANADLMGERGLLQVELRQAADENNRLNADLAARLTAERELKAELSSRQNSQTKWFNLYTELKDRIAAALV